MFDALAEAKVALPERVVNASVAWQPRGQTSSVAAAEQLSSQGAKERFALVC